MDEHRNFLSYQKHVKIVVDFGFEGDEDVVVLGSDLTTEYISIKSDYRS